MDYTRRAKYLPAAKYCVGLGYIWIENTAFNPFPGKAQTERLGNFENLWTVYLRTHTHTLHHYFLLYECAKDSDTIAKVSNSLVLWTFPLFFSISYCTWYKVIQIWPGQTVTCLHTNSPGHIWTTLYLEKYAVKILRIIRSAFILRAVYWISCCQLCTPNFAEVARTT
jgi:hypothetical protein